MLEKQLEMDLKDTQHGCPLDLPQIRQTKRKNPTRRLIMNTDQTGDNTRLRLCWLPKVEALM